MENRNGFNEWNTKTEKVWLNEIGNHTSIRRIRGIPKIILLKRYLTTFEKRKRYGKINKHEIVNFIKMKIEKLEKGITQTGNQQQ